MSTDDSKLRRSELAVPASDEEMISQAPDSGADEAFLDLEDSVAPKEKVATRENVIEGLTEYDWSETLPCYRINGVDTEWWYDDVIEVVSEAGEHVDSILVPMTRNVRTVTSIDDLLTQVEANNGLPKGEIGLQCIIETAEGITNVEAIAGASDRIESIVFGPGDYAASVGVADLTIGGGEGYPGHYWHYQIARVSAAASAHGLQTLDGPYAEIDDTDGLRDSAHWANQLGCNGKWAIHPDQIEPINEVFTPADGEAKKATRIVEEYEQAMADGCGAVRVDDEMVDAATYEMAKNVVARAEQIDER